MDGESVIDHYTNLVQNMIPRGCVHVCNPINTVNCFISSFLFLLIVCRVFPILSWEFPMYCYPLTPMIYLLI